MMRPLLDLERRFWLEGAEFYREHLAEEFLMLFPGAGAMDREQTIAGIEGGPRWLEVDLSGERVLEPGPGTRLLCYLARARRAGEEEYAALVSSVYVRRGDDWKLLFHHQSPTS